ncbi:hypothetical protein [Chitinophaga sp. S165]|uniref:hypothetical protein n=1 Tax=Chitinophaga sp. S165 TaxID=2135462 RepID=UPI000D715988|nr:hypothetical protein [Chitinophaga sp. S165]PWV44738.1 hypothetical protein C7475_11816 [Chitinophaga sp. S165]
MKKTILYLSLFLFANTTKAFAQSWIDQLRTFRDAVYQRDKEKAKQFFNFPMSDPGDGFWEVAEQDAKGDTRTHLERLHEKQYALTEELFILYFDQIFYKTFVKSFLKLPTKMLYEKGEAGVVDLTDDKINFYGMSARYDSADNTLTLSVIGRSEEKDENGEYFEGGGEYAYIYRFRIINGQLKFDKFYRAG